MLNDLVVALLGFIIFLLYFIYFTKGNWAMHEAVIRKLKAIYPTVDGIHITSNSYGGYYFFFRSGGYNHRIYISADKDLYKECAAIIERLM